MKKSRGNNHAEGLDSSAIMQGGWHNLCESFFFLDCFLGSAKRLCFWRIYEQKNADNLCSDFPVFFPMSGKKRALVFSFQFPTVEPWEDYVILRLESSAACGIILRTEHARGAFCFLAVIGEWQAHTFPLCDKIIPPQRGLLCTWQSVYWLPHARSLHDLLFLFQKVKYSG